MASSANINQSLQIRANVPAADSELHFANLSELMLYLQENLYVVDGKGGEDGVLSFGQNDPTGEENRGVSLHIRKDSREVPVAIRAWSRTKFVDLLRLAVGEVRLFVPGSTPNGWVLANGSNGTPDLTNESPHDSLSYYQFRGF